MTERRAGAAAEVSLTVGGDTVGFQGSVLRRTLRVALPELVVQRVRSGEPAADVDVPLGISAGAVSWSAPRGVDDVDELLVGAHQRIGRVVVLPEGSSAGSPRITVSGPVKTQLAIAASDLSVWTVTVARSGSVTVDTV